MGKSNGEKRVLGSTVQAFPYTAAMFTREAENPDTYTFLSLLSGIASILLKVRVAGLACVMMTVLLGVSTNYHSPQEVRQFVSCLLIGLFSVFSVYVEPNKA
eukprot:jgi/Picsp_1/3482/NSC_06320-R1_---NA---